MMTDPLFAEVSITLSWQEMQDIAACAAERGQTVSDLVHRAVMDDLVR